MSFAGLTQSDKKLFKKQVRSSAPALLQQIDVVSNENSSSTVSLITGTFVYCIMRVFCKIL